MPEINKRKFLGNAVSYQKTRPNYPNELFLALLQYWQKESDNKIHPIIADVGCGTGIATRGIYYSLNKKCKLIGIEPDLNMLEQAQQGEPDENIIFIQGTAENLPLEKNSVDIIIASQAIQYFDRPTFYQETKRVIRSNSSTIAIIENNRHWKTSPFLEKYEEFLETYSYDTHSTYSRNYRAYPFIEELNHHFQDATELSFIWSKKISSTDFLDMMTSTTSGQRAIKNLGETIAKKQIIELAHPYVDPDGLLDMPYISKAYLARN